MREVRGMNAQEYPFNGVLDADEKIHGSSSYVPLMFDWKEKGPYLFSYLHYLHRLFRINIEFYVWIFSQALPMKADYR